MTGRARCFPFLLLALLCFGGCAALQFDRLPIAPTALPEVVAKPFELQAAVTVTAQDRSPRQYMLALNVSGSAAQLALLTAQGVPVYEAGVTEGKLRTRRQSGDAPGFAAERALALLALAYGDEARIQGLLGKHYEVRTANERRELRTAQGRVLLSVNYTGNAPWYRVATLSDLQQANQIQVTSLEWRHD